MSLSCREPRFPSASFFCSKTVTTAGRVERKSPTGQALRAFIDAAAKIPNARVAYYGDDFTGTTVIVFVPSLWDEAADGVFAVKSEVLRQYPAARANIQIKGIQELGANPDNLLELLPEGATFHN